MVDQWPRSDFEKIIAENYYLGEKFLVIFLTNMSRILDHEVFDHSALADFHIFKAFS
jgi:hypothetical protein